jgi:hypothetical protein
MKKKLYVKEGVGFEGITMMQQGKSRGPKVFRFLAVFLIVIGLLGFVIAGFMQTKSQPKPEPSVVVLPTSTKSLNDALTGEPVVTDTVAPTAKSASVTPTKKISPTVRVTVPAPTIGSAQKKSLTIAVLNGSGTKGAAKEMSTALADAGYQVTRTGNADAFTYEDITVQIKKSKQQFLDQLKKDLSANNYLVTKSTADLEESESTDAVVIVGTE